MDLSDTGAGVPPGAGAPDGGAGREEPHATRLTGAEAAKAHLTLALGLALCAVAFWFELHRALAGNSLSWAYVFEWPLFGLFGLYMWWNVLHGQAAVQRSGRRSRRPAAPAVAPEFEGMLRAWQDHQRRLASDAGIDAAPADGGAESGR